jgi:hypothetical protein
MPLNMSIVRVERKARAAIEIPDDIATELMSAYEHLLELDKGCAVNVDFGDENEAKQFCRYARAFTAGTSGLNGRNLKFTRLGEPKDNPTRVTFRIYEVRERKTPDA